MNIYLVENKTTPTELDEYHCIHFVCYAPSEEIAKKLNPVDLEDNHKYIEWEEFPDKIEEYEIKDENEDSFLSRCKTIAYMWGKNSDDLKVKYIGKNDEEKDSKIICCAFVE